MVKTPRTRQGSKPEATEASPMDAVAADAPPASLPPADAALPDQPQPAEAAAAEPIKPIDLPPPIADSAAEPVGLLDPVEPAPGSEEHSRPASSRPVSPESPLPPADFSQAEPPPPPPPPEPVRTSLPPAASLPPRRGIGGLLAAGLAGGVAALALLTILQGAGLWPGAERSNATALQSEIASLRSELATLRSAAPPDLSGTVQGLEREIAALREAGAGVPQAVETRFAALESRLNETPDAAPAEAVGALQSRIAAAEALIQREGETDAATTERLAGLDQTVSDLSARVEALGQQPKVALAIASSALKASAERGAPFRAELETLRALAPNLSGTEPLDQYAQAGVPTRGQLQERWADAAAAMLATETAAGEDASVLQQFWGGVRGLVSVRPVGDVTGTGTDAIVARMEVAVNEGDFARALAEFDTLPEAAKAAGQAYADELRARVAVDEQIDATVAQAMQAA